MHSAERPRLAHDLLPGMFEMQEALVERRRKVGQQWFLNVGVAAPTLLLGASGGEGKPSTSEP